jgi:HK97 gp10 family phage protein
MAAKLKLKAKLTGARQVEQALAAIGRKALRPAARKGVVGSAQVAAKAAKALVPANTKSLRKSIGHKVKAIRDGSGFYGLIGPRRDTKKSRDAGKFKYRVRVGSRKRAGGLPSVVKYANPVKYAHLVEFGRRAVTVSKKTLLSDGSVVFGKRVKAVPPRPFMRPAWEANKAACEGIIRQALADAVKGAKR